MHKIFATCFGILLLFTPLKISSAEQDLHLYLKYKSKIFTVELEEKRENYRIYSSPTGEKFTVNGIYITQYISHNLSIKGWFMGAGAPYFFKEKPKISEGLGANKVLHIAMEGEIVKFNFSCDIASPYVKFYTENCYSKQLNLRFENKYWIDDTGNIICSAQWVNPFENGFIEVFRDKHVAKQVDLRYDECVFEIV